MVGANTNAPSANVVPTPQSTRTVADSDSDDEGQPMAPCKLSPCTKLISHFGAFFTAKRKRSTITTSQTKRRCAIIVDDIDTSDAEGDIHDKGMVFLEHDV